ncbi:unnamed protein product [Sphagnum troendelagicum]|uniref:Uncharacterized protein n=1 Tax=Sphagnum troendelagicum TaxID=128251 RepID=A0ABP0UTK8_9BRYO
MLYNKPTGREIMARKISSGDHTAAAVTRVISWSSQKHVQGSSRRRLLFSPIDRAATVEGDPGLPTNSTARCKNEKTGLPISCPTSTTLLIVGITCMLCLIGVALILLACSCRKRRRNNGNAITEDPQSDRRSPADAATLPDSGSLQTVIMVRVAGDEEARFVARPAPLKTESTTMPDSDSAEFPTEEEPKAESTVEHQAVVVPVNNQPWNSDPETLLENANALVVEMESHECSEQHMNE